MKKILLLSLVVLFTFTFSGCSMKLFFIPPFPVQEIPLSGKSIINCGTTDHTILLASYNIDQNKRIVEKDVNILEYNLKEHQNQFVSQIKNTRMNYINFYNFSKPFIYTTPSGKKIYFRHRWEGTTYLITKSEFDQELIILERKNMLAGHLINFVLVDSLKNNTIQYDFLSGDQFECHTFEILQYDIQSGKIKKVAEGEGSLFSVPYFETKTYIYFDVKQNNQDKSVFCYRKPDSNIAQTSLLKEQYLVGSDYDSDLLVIFSKNESTLTLWKGSHVQEIIPCSVFPHDIDRVTIKTFHGKVFLLIIIQDTFNSEKRMLRWIEYDPLTKNVKEINWNEDLQYKLDRGNYHSSKFDYYILAYLKSSRKVVFGIVNMIKGTIVYRETNHQILPGHEFQSSFFIQDKYCFWTEGTTLNKESVTSEVQTFNPVAYYCSLEEPLLQKLND